MKTDFSILIPLLFVIIVSCFSPSRTEKVYLPLSREAIQKAQNHSGQFSPHTGVDQLESNHLTLETAHTTCLLGTEIADVPIRKCLDGVCPDDKQLSQYIQCMFRMYGFLDYDGSIKNESIYEAVAYVEKDHNETDRAVDVCQLATADLNTTQYDVAYEFFKCFRNETKDAHYWSILKYLLTRHVADPLLTPIQSLRLETVHHTCAMGSEVKMQTIKDALNGNYSEDKTITDYFQCVFRMYGYIDPQGRLQNATMLNSIPPQDKNRIRTEKAIITCLYVIPEEIQHLAYNFFRCFRNQTSSAEYWGMLRELSSRNDKPDVSNVLVDFLL